MEKHTNGIKGTQEFSMTVGPRNIHVSSGCPLVNKN